MDIQTFARKRFTVQAVQVTEQNINDVAVWCYGDVRYEKRDGKYDADTAKPYVKVKVHRPLNEKQTRAYIGDWVLKAGTGYKVYTDKALQNCFDPEMPAGNVFEQNKTVFEEEAERAGEILRENRPRDFGFPVPEEKLTEAPEELRVTNEVADSTRVKLGFNEPRDLMKVDTEPEPEPETERTAEEKLLEEIFRKQ